MKFKPSFTLILLASLLAALLGLARVPVAHAATTLTVNDCSNDSQLQADVSTANSDNAGDTITFACSGTGPFDIPLTSTLGISGSMTLDGSGQQVTLDGQHQRTVFAVASSVTLTLKAITIANGSGSASGGILNNGTVSISNSTFSGNSTSSASGGGGIQNFFGTVSISNSTFSGNSASFAGGGIGNLGTVNIGESIVADNTGGDCFASSPLSDQGYNLESGMGCGFTGTGSLQNTDPKLDPSGLQNNGGPTQTIALLATSPAIDHIPAANCPVTDQRGVSRLPGEHCDIGAFEFPDTTSPTLQLPASITVNATSSSGAVVSYTATATDDDGDALTPSCAPASGSTFPVGTTTVNCSASEPGSNTATGSFQVTVQDIDLGLTNLPTNITTNATSPQGATVPYTPPTVVDEESPLPAPICMPASGSTFAIGTTTVTCTVSDSDDTPSSVSQTFTVTVKGAAAQVNDLITTVNGFTIASGLKASLVDQLQTVLADLQANNTAQACLDLTSFINHVKAQSGKGLTTSQATQLLTAATRIKAVLGC